MAKKILFVLAFVSLITTGAFAQFSLESGVTFGGTPTPLIGMAYSLEKLDILAGLGFSYWKETTSYNWGSASVDGSSFNLYGGVAPKASLSDKWSLSFPILLDFTFPKKDVFDILLLAGARARYSLTNNWGIYLGFLITAFSYEKDETGVYTSETTSIFDGGMAVLGVSYRF